MPVTIKKIMENGKLKIAILGWAREGKSAAEFLHKRLSGSAEIHVLDEGPVPVYKRDVRFKFRVGKKFSALNGFDLILRSPGIPYLRKEIQQAIKAGVAVTSVTNIFLQELYATRGKMKTPKVIAITGTKGKGTTASLLYEMLKKAKKKVVLAGNIGTPMLDVLERAKRADFVVLELSSFQLQDIKHSVDLAVLLSISRDHLDHHKNMAEYVNAKLELFKHQEKDAKAYVISESAKYLKKLKGLKAKLNILRTDQIRLFEKEELKIVGRHNFENAVVAARIAKDLGVPNPVISYVARNFKGLPHRIEFVRKLDKISFYNDSFSTIPASTVAAIKSFDIPTVLIVGGRPKVNDYSSVQKALKKSSVKNIVLFGENSKELRRQLAGAGIKLTLGGYTLSSAVERAYTFARNLKVESVVLFSPASTSFDLFSDRSERGDKFKELVLKLSKS
ncbi:MAG: UDP-N-acetylmuramoyl-L-alanine--D-glutamate ligase [bacterium]|nr:UDP-N-acetylmuramoyl-L-alanine--D-glutamate ligase [bacterium]